MKKITDYIINPAVIEERKMNAGFEIMIDDRGGHRLRKEVLDLIQSQVFLHMHYKENNIISKQ